MNAHESIPGREIAKRNLEAGLEIASFYPAELIQVVFLFFCRGPFCQGASMGGRVHGWAD